MIKSIDLTYYIPIALSLLSFIGIFFYGKRQVEKKSQVRVLRFIPMLSVIALIAGVFYITYYYQNQLSSEKEKFFLLQKQNYFNDSILLTSKTKNNALDSLKILNDELKKLLANINKQEKITGENSNIKEKVKEKITKTNQEIGNIESYNELIDKPKYLEKGYSYTGNTSNFVFFCPTDKTSDFIDLKLRFQDKFLIDKIDCIYIEVFEVRDDGKNWMVFDQAYKAKDGVNAFKIRNYLKNKKTTLLIGYVLKSEITKATPTFEKVSCVSE
jgi:hypothetical protein